MKTYTVTVNFAGLIGVEQDYEVWAESKEDAKAEAIQLALEDLEVMAVAADDDESEDEDYE